MTSSLPAIARPARLVTLFAALACLVIGAVALVGWHLGSETLVAVRPGYTPVQYNTALAFLGCACALAASAFDRTRAATGSAFFLVLLAALTLVEYIGNFDLPLDRLFFGDASGVNPGRMAPNTAVALLACGIALLLLHRGLRWRVYAAAVLGSSVAALAAVPLAGYLAGLPAAYRWGSEKPMAFLTSVALLATAVGIVASAWRRSIAGTKQVPGWVPVSAFLFGAAVSGMLAQALLSAARIGDLAPEAHRSMLVAVSVTLLFGISAAAALAGVIALAQRALRRSRELQVTEAELQHLNRALRLVSACNHALAHASGEADLLQRICQLAVDLGGYRLAYIAFPQEDEAKTVSVVAKAGQGGEYLQDGYVSWADEPRGRGPTGTAIRTARAVTANDLLHDDSFLPWRERALRFGFRSSLAVPLLHDGRVLGSFTIYAPPENAFQSAEVDLFQQLANDLAFGIVALRDRRARAAVEQQLRANEQRYRCLTIATAQVVWITDPDGLVTADMPSWREFTGATWDDIRGWGWLDSLHAGDREATARVWADAVAHRTLYETEYRLRRHDGEYRHVWVRGVPVLEPSGAIREWVGTCTDITAAKRAAEELRQASLYARSLLEASLDPLVTISRAGAITDVNQATEAATGVPRSVLIGTDFCTYFTEPERARAGYQRVYAEGIIKDYPLTVRHVSGSTTDVLYNASVYRNGAGEVEGVFAAARDMTERKRAEQELERYAEELQRSNGELQEFAFVASHDLQEPLRKITAFSERLRDRAAGQLDETSLDYLNRMHSAAARMGALIDSLLQYSRVATRALPFEEVDLASIMLGILADLEQRIFESRATVKIQRLPNVHGDPTQLRQLLQNLVANALKFHAPDTPPCLLVASQSCAGRWQISVSDQGIGFDPAYTEKIFRPFQRLHGRNEYEGSGMGLAICRKIAQRHGAAIAVTSAPGQGATFTISLPAAPERTESCLKVQSASSSPKMTTMTTC